MFTLTDFTTDSVGDIYFADNGANRVRKFTPGGNISAVAGNGTTLAQLSNPSGIAIEDAAGTAHRPRS